MILGKSGHSLDVDFMYFLKIIFHFFSDIFTSLYGALFGLFVLAIFNLKPFRDKLKKITPFFEKFNTQSALYILIALFAAISISYIFYPNYLDHLEATIASMGKFMRTGGELYPSHDFYPYHGMLYGPISGEIQFLIQSIGLPIMEASKIPGVLSFFAAMVLLLLTLKTPLSRSILLFLFPFGCVLFWNRADSYLLFIVSLSIYFSEKRLGDKSLAILIGLLAGAASALKLHGAAYVWAIYCTVLPPMGATAIIPISILLLSTMISFLAFYIPPLVSLTSFYHYIRLASHHGLSLNEWFHVFTYLIFLNIPIFYLIKTKSTLITKRSVIFTILLIEFFVSILAAKPKAGIHHLLPFIPITAWLIQKNCTCTLDDRRGNLKLLNLCLFISSFFVALSIILPFTRIWSTFADAKSELISFSKKYPDAVLAPTDISSSSLVFLRVLLPNTQIDYSSFMDLQYSGIRETALIEKMKNGELKHLILPKEGIPFSQLGYAGKPLFSNETAFIFQNNYHSQELGEYYCVFSFSPNQTPELFLLLPKSSCPSM